MAEDLHKTAEAPDIDVDRVIDATLALAAERGWQEVSLLDIARSAGISLAALHRRFPGKQAILAAFSRRVDEAVLEEHEPAEPDESARDRLFDVLMLRFDHLQPHRAAIASILQAYRRDPFLALGGLRQLRRSMRWMLEAADLGTSGLRGEFRLDGLCAVYLATVKTWLDDDSPDMARTMAALDGYLRRAETPVAVVEGVRERAGSRRGSRDDAA